LLAVIALLTLTLLTPITLVHAISYKYRLSEGDTLTYIFTISIDERVAFELLDHVEVYGVVEGGYSVTEEFKVLKVNVELLDHVEEFFEKVYTPPLRDALERIRSGEPSWTLNRTVTYGDVYFQAPEDVMESTQLQKLKFNNATLIYVAISDVKAGMLIDDETYILLYGVLEYHTTFTGLLEVKLVNANVHGVEIEPVSEDTIRTVRNVVAKAKPIQPPIPTIKVTTITLTLSTTTSKPQTYTTTTTVTTTITKAEHYTTTTMSSVHHTVTVTTTTLGESSAILSIAMSIVALVMAIIALARSLRR